MPPPALCVGVAVTDTPPPPPPPPPPPAADTVGEAATAQESVAGFNTTFLTRKRDFLGSALGVADAAAAADDDDDVDACGADVVEDEDRVGVAVAVCATDGVAEVIAGATIGAEDDTEGPATGTTTGFAADDDIEGTADATAVVGCVDAVDMVTCGVASPAVFEVAAGAAALLSVAVVAAALLSVAAAATPAPDGAATLFLPSSGECDEAAAAAAAAAATDSNTATAAATTPGPAPVAAV